MKAYIVLCQYEGCEECSSGAHIVGVYDNPTKAIRVAKEHSWDANTPNKDGHHYHYYFSEITEMEVE